ncbi:MAG: type III pantothenate kinase [Gammaproteobacteria bacterium]|nr:type III pantothenate kinase [Gammaproteobacteria bacterium]
MILLVDVGNSRIKWVTWEQGRYTRRGDLFHGDTPLEQLGARLWRDLPLPMRVLIANVAGERMADALAEWVQSHWGAAVQFAVTEVANYGVQNAYSNPKQMGVDRWVAMIGARAQTKQACCIVDCGTAITIDALSSRGEHQGGVIFPGAHLMRQTLFRETRQIPISPQGRLALFGKSTQDCVWGGTLHAVAAAIEGITARMRTELESGAVCLLTGGGAETLQPYLQGDFQLSPDLIFNGLLTITLQGSEPKGLPQGNTFDLVGQRH